jgi:hypothetical protein
MLKRYGSILNRIEDRYGVPGAYFANRLAKEP